MQQKSISFCIYLYLFIRTKAYFHTTAAFLSQVCLDTAIYSFDWLKQTQAKKEV